MLRRRLPGSAARFLAFAAVAVAFGPWALPSQAAEDAPGAWAVWNVAGPAVAGRSDWTYWFDGQLRWTDPGDSFRQVLLRPGLGYRTRGGVLAEAGYALVVTDGGPDHLTEHRFWQRVTLGLGTAAGGNWTSRTWLEQRWRDDGDEPGMRLRQMLRVDWPLSGARVAGVFVGVEPMVALLDADWGPRRGFEECRTSVGVSLRAGEATRVEVGYQNQYQQRRGQRDADNHLLLVTVLWRP